MNKQELLDKAVHELRGVYANSIEGGNVVEHFLWHVGGNCYQRFISNHGFIGEFVCTKDEFQQRARELGYLDAPTVKESLTNEWYDYDNQKAIALPPVGTECEAFLMDTSYKNAWFKVEVIKNHLDRECACMRIENRGLTWCNTFRPLNWNRKAEEKKKRVVDAAMAIAVDAHMTEDILGSLYDAGYLKLPN